MTRPLKGSNTYSRQKISILRRLGKLTCKMHVLKNTKNNIE